MDEIMNDLRAYVADKVAEGFEPRAEIIENAEEYLTEQYGHPVSRTDIIRVVDEELRDHYRRQAGWPEPTDCDRLDEAFTDLNDRGVVARQNFTCCNTCGHAEIWDEVDAARETQDVAGYAFYHWQDTESAREHGTLWMKYSGPDPAETGRLVADVLSRAGLNVRWDGDPGWAIEVTGLTWRKRRAVEAPSAE